MSNSETQNAGRFGHSSKSVLSDLKQYLSFFAALLIVQTLFWTLLVTTGINNRSAHESLTQDYEYHVLLNGLSSESNTKLYNVNTEYRAKAPELWPELHFLGGSPETGYRVGVKLNAADPTRSYSYLTAVNSSQNIGIASGSIEKTPLFTEDPELETDGRDNCFSIAAALAVLALVFGFISHKLKRVKRDDRWGERVYVSTTKQNAQMAVRRVLFALMAVSGAAAMIFLLIALSHGNGILYFFIYLFLVIICALFMTELFNIRVNHYKFRYGVYMTFGAGFRKLYGTAIREMATVSAITLLPSLGIAMLISMVLYLPTGATVFLPLEAIVGVLVLNAILVLASTYIPMKTMAQKPPISLIYAQDNSNLVTSPRRSFHVFGKKFPLYYEVFGMWRFRRYFIRLTATAVAFSSVFLCGIYISDLVGKSFDKDNYEFAITDKNQDGLISDAHIEAVVAALNGKNGFEYLYWNDETLASAESFHALVSPNNVKRHNSVYNISGDPLEADRQQAISEGYSLTTDSYKFVSYNKTLIDSIVNNGIYNIEGDMYAVLDDPSKIIISEYITNRAEFDFAPGDVIYLAVPTDAIFEIDESLILSGQRGEALAEMISISDFNYVRCEVAAVVDYGGQDGSFICGLGSQFYTELLQSGGADAPELFGEILVYADKNATVEQLGELRAALIDEFEWAGYTVTQTYNVTRSILDRNAGHRTVIFTVSLLVMLVSPLIWFFSQLQFYRRREKEMYILRSLGAKANDMRRIYLLSGLMLSGLSAVMTLVMSFIADYLIYLICTFAVGANTSVGGMTVQFYMPPIALLMCLVTAVICGFLSSWLPYALRRVLISKTERYTSDGN